MESVPSLKRIFIPDIKAMNPDIVCLQETKGGAEDVKSALELLPDYKAFVNSSKARKGYSGTAILTKTEPLQVTYDMGIEEHDQEGRVITAEYPTFLRHHSIHTKCGRRISTAGLSYAMG